MGERREIALLCAGLVSGCLSLNEVDTAKGSPDGGAGAYDDGGLHESGWPGDSGAAAGSAGQGSAGAGGSLDGSAQGGNGASGGAGGTPQPPLCASGVEVGGSCWFYGDWGQSCTQVCATQGGAYDDATRSYAGSAGTDAYCTSVLQALSVPPAQFSYDNNCGYGPVGCGLRDNGSGYYWRRCGNATTADATDASTRRACACTI